MSTSAVSAAKDKYLFQYVVAVSASLVMLSGSSAFAWVSPTLPFLYSDDSPIPVTSDQGGWIVLALMIGRLFAVIPAAWMMDKFGRKATLIASSVPLIIGWILILDADTVFIIYIARILWGISLGAVHSVVLPMYLGEIASDKIRGSIATILGVMAKSGIFFVYSVGPFVSMFTLAWMEIIPLVIFLGTFIWLPESPYYLLGQNKVEQAKQSLIRLRGHSNVLYEFEMMVEAVKKAEQNKGSFKQLLAQGNRRGLIIVLGLAIAIILTGTEAILSYSQLIFQQVGSPVNGNILNVVLGAILVGTTVIASCTVDRIGRRLMLLYSTVGLALCNTVIAIFFLLIRLKIDIKNFSCIPMLAVMIYIFSYGMGLATVTFALMGEILPKNLKAIAGIVFGITISSLSLIVSKLFQVVSDYLGNDVIFGAFAVFSYLFFPFVWYLIPETKGKSLTIILEEMNKCN